MMTTGIVCGTLCINPGLWWNSSYNMIPHNCYERIIVCSVNPCIMVCNWVLI